MLKNPQTTLTVEEESPLPGGLANGLWNARPINPETKVGMAFSVKEPAKKYDTSQSQSMM
jgi:hypothetical protein